MRQPGQPTRDLFAADPIGIHKSLAFAERGVEPRVSEREAAFDTAKCNVALNGRKLERQRLDRLRQSLQRLFLEPLNVDLDEGRCPCLPISASSVVIGTATDSVPALRLPSRARLARRVTNRSTRSKRSGCRR